MNANTLHIVFGGLSQSVHKDKGCYGAPQTATLLQNNDVITREADCDLTHLLQENNIQRVHVVCYEFVGSLVVYGVRHVFEHISSKVKDLSGEGKETEIVRWIVIYTERERESC